MGLAPQYVGIVFSSVYNKQDVYPGDGTAVTRCNQSVSQLCQSKISAGIPD
jgi:hypothetical protein